MLKIVSWNLAHRPEVWRALLDASADVALVQEACAPPSDVIDRIGFEPEPWRTEGAGLERPWRASVVQLNPRIRVQRLPARSIADAQPGEPALSRLGTLAAAEVLDPESEALFTVISMYAPWEYPHASTGSSWIYADASVHRLISDLSVFVGQQHGHRIIAAGDLNILFGYGEHGSEYWAGRYRTVFDRMEAIGLRFVGPQSPNGRQADPWPNELPPGSGNVPTFRTNQQTAETATRQLDFVFASADIAERVTVHALNRPEEWGPSDHCMIRIEVR